MAQQRVGVIGWLPYYDTPHARTVAACDLNETRVKEVTAKHPDVAAYTDYRKMAEEARLDAVIIATPNWLHCEMTKYFLARGIHVFVEKPMGINRRQFDELVRAQRKSKKICAVDFELRVSPATKRLKEIIASGEIGDLVGVEFIHHRGAWLAQGNNVWRTDPSRSGGLFLMEICHEIDLFRCLFGEITHVQSFKFPNVLPQYPAAMPDNVVTHIWFEGGRMGNIVAGHTSSVWNAPTEKYDDLGHDMYFIVIGTRGCMRLESIRQKLVVCRYDEFHPDSKRGKRVEFSRLEDYSSVPNFCHDIAANHHAFFDSCARGKPFHQDTFDAWKSHVVCLAAEQSAVSGFKKIKLNYKLA